MTLSKGTVMVGEEEVIVSVADLDYPGQSAVHLPLYPPSQPLLCSPNLDLLLCFLSSSCFSSSCSG